MIIRPASRELILPTSIQEWRQPQSFVPALGVWSPPGHSFCLVAKLYGEIVWRGHFRSQDELDVFCWSLFRGELDRDDFAQGLAFPAWNPELAQWPVVYELAISVTTLGTAGNLSGGTVALSSLTAPAGALVFIAVCEASNAGDPGGGAISDSNSNIWSYGVFGLDGNPGTADGVVGGGYLLPASFAGYSGATITYTKGHSGNSCAISALYATGIANIHAGAGTPRSFGGSRATGTSAGYGASSGGIDLSAFPSTYLSPGDLVIGITASKPGASSQGYVGPSSGWSGALPAPATDGQATVGAAVAGTYAIYAGGSLIPTCTINSADWGSSLWTFSAANIINAFNMPMMGF